MTEVQNRYDDTMRSIDCNDETGEKHSYKAFKKEKDIIRSKSDNTEKSSKCSNTFHNDGEAGEGEGSFHISMDELQETREPRREPPGFRVRMKPGKISGNMTYSPRRGTYKNKKAQPAESSMTWHDGDSTGSGHSGKVPMLPPAKRNGQICYKTRFIQNHPGSLSPADPFTQLVEGNREQMQVSKVAASQQRSDTLGSLGDLAAEAAALADKTKISSGRPTCEKPTDDMLSDEQMRAFSSFTSTSSAVRVSLTRISMRAESEMSDKISAPRQTDDMSLGRSSFRRYAKGSSFERTSATERDTFDLLACSEQARHTGRDTTTILESERLSHDMEARRSPEFLAPGFTEEMLLSVDAPVEINRSPGYRSEEPNPVDKKVWPSSSSGSDSAVITGLMSARLRRIPAGKEQTSGSDDAKVLQPRRAWNRDDEDVCTLPNRYPDGVPAGFGEYEH